MAKLWENRKAPIVLEWEEASKFVNKEEDDEVNKLASHKIWSISQCCKVFCESVNALHKRLEEEEAKESQVLFWDKDDE